MDRALIISYLQAAQDQLAYRPYNISLTSAILFRRWNGPVTMRPARSPGYVKWNKTQTRHIADRERLRADLAVPNAVKAAKENPS